MKMDLRGQATLAAQRLQAKKDRLFKTLNYDPDLTAKQVRERFGFSYETFQKYKREWMEARS